MHRARSALLLVALILFASVPAVAQMGDMKMPMDKPASTALTRQAYTTNRAFLVKIVSIPNPIPYEKYFKLGLEVYDGGDPSKKISDAQVKVAAGMRHGMSSGFMHGMQSTPKVDVQNGVVTVSGMYFHMQGPWTLATTVTSGGKEGVAYLQLPCCAQ